MNLQPNQPQMDILFPFATPIVALVFSTDSQRRSFFTILFEHYVFDNFVQVVRYIPTNGISKETLVGMTGKLRNRFHKRELPAEEMQEETPDAPVTKREFVDFKSEMGRTFATIDERFTKIDERFTQMDDKFTKKFEELKALIIVNRA